MLIFWIWCSNFLVGVLKNFKLYVYATCGIRVQKANKFPQQTRTYIKWLKIFLYAFLKFWFLFKYIRIYWFKYLGHRKYTKRLTYNFLHCLITIQNWWIFTSTIILLQVSRFLLSCLLLHHRFLSKLFKVDTIMFLNKYCYELLVIIYYVTIKIILGGNSTSEWTSLGFIFNYKKVNDRINS